MKKLFLTALLALPLNAMSEEVADTTFTYNGKQITISEDSVETHVSIYSPDGTEMKKTKESTFADAQEIERFYISSPFFSTNPQYIPTTPIASVGFAGLSGSILGFGSAEGVPTKLTHSSESAFKFIDMGFWLNKQRTWGISAATNIKATDIKFRGDNVLAKDADGRAWFQHIEGAKSSRLFALGFDTHLMLKWYKYFKNPDNDRLSIGFGFTATNYALRNNFTSYKLNGEIFPQAAGLKLNNNIFGLRLQVSWGGCSIYLQKSLTPQFKDGFGPKCYPFSIGIGIAY